MADNTPGTDLIRPGEDSKYAVLQMPDTELQELISEGLAPGESLTMKDLRVVKVPSSGATTFLVPDPMAEGGERASRTIEGVLIRRDTRRGWWEKSIDDGGGDDPPTCYSDDGITGQANTNAENPDKAPAMLCEQCPFNEFGSARDGNGKACKEFRVLFVMEPDALLPTAVRVPPTSLANAKGFFVALLNSRLRPSDVEVKITLESATNAQGTKYSRMVFNAGERLDPKAKAKFAGLAELLKPSLDAAARRAVDDASDEDAAAATK